MLTRLHSIPRFGLPYRGADFAAALTTLLRPTPPPDVFGLLGDSPKFWTRSGRQALCLLLTALGLKPGAGVAVPLFTDPSLAVAILAAGCRPIFIDVDPETLTMDPRSLDAAAGRFSAVVAVHLFGQLADIPALAAAAGNVPIIEDAAHAPLSFLNGRIAGASGVASFYSFASTKYWPAGGGGLAVVHDGELAGRMAREIQALATPSHLEEFRSLILQGLKSAVFTRRLYGFLGRPLRRWADQWALLEPRLDRMAIQRPHAAVARRQALRFPPRVERQRANSLRLLSLLASAEDVILPHEPPGRRYNYHLFPVLLRDSRERTAVRAALWRRFVDTSTIYSESIDKCRKVGYRGGCPVSESVASRLITLPNHADLSGVEVEAVGEVFLSSLRSYRTGGTPRAEARPAAEDEGLAA
jgi:dTDP-4-amino-4,6-dideoxygalactose transaminase